MKTQTKVFALFASIAISLTLSCSKEQATDPQQVENFSQTISNFERNLIEKMGAERAAEIIRQSQNTSRIPIIPEGMLLPGILNFGAAPYNGNYDFGSADFWEFTGNTGDIVSIDVNRITCEMDPVIWVFSGSGDTDFLVGPIAFGDDEDPAACQGGCQSANDPKIEGFVLPTLGVYTIALWDLGNPGECGSGPQEYSIVMTVESNSDADGDGCNDDVDPHPNSILEEFVIIDGCDSGVANVFITQCSTMLDLIADCAATASDHGDFVSCVSQLTNEWKSAGFIVGSEKGDILSCAGQSNIPY